MLDENLLSASDAILQAPQKIAQLNAQKSDALAAQAKALTDDNTNKIFYDKEKSILKSYFDEEKLINGNIHTEYSDSDLTNSAQLLPGNLHFPVPGWIKFPPKLLASNSGTPISTTPAYEQVENNTALGIITFISAGYSDGPLTQSLFAAHTVGGTIDCVSQFTNGHRLTIIEGSNVAYGIVQSSVLVALPSPHYQHTMSFSVDANFTTSATASEFYSGWTDAQRQGIPDAFLAMMEAQLDAAVNAIQARVSDEIIVLTNSQDQSTPVINAKNYAINYHSNLTSWESFPVSGPASRFSDANLALLSGDINNRLTNLTSRLAEIATALGSISQDGEGAYSGSGHFLSLFKWIDFRINLTFGTLRNYYNFALIISYLDTKINGENNKVSEYTNIMLVKLLSAEPNGSDTITLVDVVGLSVGNVVKIIDADSASMSASILNINGNNVQLSAIVPTTYTLNKQARLIKEL